VKDVLIQLIAPWVEPELTEMVRFSFTILIVLGLMLTSYFGLAAWRASGEDQPDITGTVTD
jgi:hypothetical protein